MGSITNGHSVSSSNNALFEEAWDIMLAYTSSLAVKSVIQLGVLDIIDCAGAGNPLSVEEIAQRLTKKPDSNATGVNMPFLARLLRFLASCKFLTVVHGDAGPMNFRYGLSAAARCFVKSNEENLSGFLLHLLDPVFLDTFHKLPECVREAGKDPFILTHGKDEWDFLSESPVMRAEFNVGQASVTKGTIRNVLGFYDGFKDINTLVDVGGASGQALSEIIAVHPHLHAINFDLPHVIAAVRKFPGIEYVAGDMFESVPRGDAIHFKTVLHDWDDEHVIKALTNCYKATPPNGRVIICDLVIAEEVRLDTQVQQRKLAHDMVMLTHRGIGFERTTKEWSHLLVKGGFSRIKFYGLDHVVSLIEAFKP